MMPPASPTLLQGAVTAEERVEVAQSLPYFGETWVSPGCAPKMLAAEAVETAVESMTAKATRIRFVRFIVFEKKKAVISVEIQPHRFRTAFLPPV